MPTSSLTAYVTFRRLQADYSVKLGQKNVNFAEVQKDWLDKLTGFVKAFPKADDTPDAMLQLGMVSSSSARTSRRRTGTPLWPRRSPRKPAAGHQGRRRRPPARPGRQPDAAGRPHPGRPEHHLRHRQAQGQGGGGVLQGRLERPGGRRLRQAEGGSSPPTPRTSNCSPSTSTPPPRRRRTS
ncbi:MAG: hypothetical protein U0736_10805 [Gemmataceae bacterium]